eukprot:TRINITY_DN48004_c0_g1_i1.p1 TRINITY_DN48004_c0_g1~~TRINITY_DN48004_c0_g1_i1.p1  ORF type:complete len:113 (+),score=4.21 TRINITY_DN48004_c0_g1_i1:181-519(+)
MHTPSFDIISSMESISLHDLERECPMSKGGFEEALIMVANFSLLLLLLFSITPLSPASSFSFDIFFRTSTPGKDKFFFFAYFLLCNLFFTSSLSFLLFSSSSSKDIFFIPSL